MTVLVAGTHAQFYDGRGVHGRVEALNFYGGADLSCFRAFDYIGFLVHYVESACSGCRDFIENKKKF